jgi:predicted Zn-dependent protease
MAGIAGIRGDKTRGLQMLAEAGKGGGETSTDARVALALFLRREGQFEQSREVVHTLTRDHPKNFLFALEDASLLSEENRNSEAAASLRNLLSACNQGRYPNPHVEMAWFTLGEALRSQGRLPEALEAFETSAEKAGNTPDYRQRALLAAGEISDLLAERGQAVLDYRAAIALDGSSEEAQLARKYLDRPYNGR